MEIVAVAVTVVPLLVIMALLARLLQRRLRPARRATPPGRFPGGGPGGPNDAGDRSPTRPRNPTRAGGMALPEPHDDAGDDGEVVVRVDAC